MKLNKLLTEIKLSRIWNHIVRDKKAIGIITAFRGENPTIKNIELNRDLAHDIKQSGYGYVFVEGHYIENKNQDNERKVKEDSILIIGTTSDNGRLKHLIKNWIKKYNQEAAIYKPENSEDAYLIDDSGKEIKLGKIKFNKISDFMTKVKKGQGTFIFEEFSFDTNFFGKLLQKNLRK